MNFVGKFGPDPVIASKRFHPMVERKNNEKGKKTIECTLNTYFFFKELTLICMIRD